MISETLQEDLIANAVLGIALLVLACTKDLCKRIAHSDCAYDKGLKIRLPTWRARDDDDTEI